MPHTLTTGRNVGRIPHAFPTSATTGPEAWPGWTGSFTQTIVGDDLIITEGGTADNHRVISGIHMQGGTIHTAAGVQYLDIVGCLVEGWQPELGGINLSWSDNHHCSISYCRIHAASDADGDQDSFDNVRLGYGIRVFADDLVIAHNEVFWTPDAIQIAGSRNTITGNYVHDSTFWDDGQGSNPGGDHNNCLLSNGGEVSGLVITGNTFLLNRQGAGMAQTGALSLQQSAEFPGSYVDCHVEGNLLTGGGYSLYAGYEPGKAGNSPGINVVVRDNHFSTRYFDDAGNFGAVTAAQPWGSNGNLWENNRWHDGIRAGQPIPAP
jgi:hypothetical protein